MILRSARLCAAAGLLALIPGLRAQNPAVPLPQTVRPVTPTGPIIQGMAAPAPLAVKNGDQFVDFAISDVPIDGVLDALTYYTGRFIIRPGQLQVQPTGFSLKVTHIPISELVTALESLLTVNGIAVIPLGDHFLKIVNLSASRTEAPEYISGSTLDLPPSDKIATKIYQLNFLRAEELFTQINPMFSQGIGGSMIILPLANAAMVTDTIVNLQRLETMINQLDHPEANGYKPVFYTLRNGAKASDLVQKIHTLLAGPHTNRVSSATNYLADDRTNQVIVLCNDSEKSFFDDLINRLDIAADPNTRTEVIYLKHADATILAQTLVALVSGQNAAAQKANSQSVRPGEITPPTQPAMNGAPAPLGGIVANAAAREAAAAGTNEFSSLMTIEPDERSNSIVVYGLGDDIRLIHDLIEKLDAAVPQVRIEVIIAEVTLSDTDVSGITSLGLTVGPNAKTGASQVLTWAGGGTSTATPGTSVAGFDFTGGIVNPLAFNAALNATSAGGKNIVHILQAPVIVTAHNQPAEFTAGQQVPIISGGQSTIATTGTTPINSFSSTYQTVATDLTVTPLIGDNGDVQLKIDQKVDNLDGSITIQAGDTQPIISHQEAKSFITVKSGQMIVVGGMQKTSKSATQNKIGLLYEIPIISQLLGGHTDDLERTELLFFIRPEIIAPEDGTSDTQKRINEMSNHDQINQFLTDPTPKPDSKKQNFLDRFKD